MSPMVAELYHYALEHRMPAYLHTQEHQRRAQQARSLLDRLRRDLPPQLQARLEAYLEAEGAAVLTELEAMFQAGLSAGLELSRL